MIEAITRKRALVLAITLATLVSACASFPKANVNYRFALTHINISVTRSISCDANNSIYYADAVSVTPTYDGDETRLPNPIDMAALNDAFSSSTVHPLWYSGGRLKSINTETAGQGAAILNTAIKVATAASRNAEGADHRADLCTFANGREKKAFTLTYDLTVDPPESTQTVEVPAHTYAVLAANQHDPADWVREILGPVYVHLNRRGVSMHRVDWTPPSAASHDHTFIALPLREADTVEIALTSKSNEHWVDDAPITDAAGAPITPRPPRQHWDEAQIPTPIWHGSIIAPSAHSTTYYVPIPRPSMFGSNKVTLALDDAGEITEWSYANASGVGDALGVVQTYQTANPPNTLADEVTAVKTRADLIAQTQRLSHCEADPTDCK